MVACEKASASLPELNAENHKKTFHFIHMGSLTFHISFENGMVGNGCQSCHRLLLLVVITNRRNINK
jgi:hypothetical protein